MIDNLIHFQAARQLQGKNILSLYVKKKIEYEGFNSQIEEKTTLYQFHLGFEVAILTK